MKKLLLLLLCVPLLFSCGEKEEKKTDEGSLNKEITTEMFEKEITREMLNDGYTGIGTCIAPNGNKYVGEFKDGKFHGQGTLTYANGRALKGLWENDEFLGNE